MITTRPCRRGLLLAVTDETTRSYRGVTGQNSRSASSPSLLTSLFSLAPVCPGITPILPKSPEWAAGRSSPGVRQDQILKTILYLFGFTRNNAGYDNKRIHALRFILMAGSAVSGQNSCIHNQCVRYVKNN